MNDTLLRIGKSLSLRRIAYVVLAGVVAVTLASCGKGGGGSNSAQMRFLNVLVGGGPINVTVGSNTPVTGLAFEGITGSQSVDAGTQEIKVSVSGGTSTIIDGTTSLSGGTPYTYVVFGTATAPLSTILLDQIVTTPNSGTFAIRVANAAFGTAALDLYVTAPGAPLATASPNISNILLKSVSGFVTLAPGSLQVRLTLTNSKQVIYDSGPLTFVNQQSYQLIAYTKGSSTLVNAALFNLDPAVPGAIDNSNIAQFKVIHAAPGTGTINTFVDGNIALANIPYQGASSYGAVAAGTHTVTVEPVATPGAVIASAQPPFSAATDTSFVLTGSPGATAAVVLNDNNLPGSTGRARVRFVNVAVGLGPVDVYVNFAPQVSGLATNTASNYLEYLEGTYSINFDIAGTTNVVLSMPAVALTAGQTNTLYLVGTPTTLAGVLTRDD